MAMSDGEIWTWADGVWHQGEARLIGPTDHGFWQGSMVFDGARGFEGTAPDLDLHCARVNASAEAMGLEPTLEAGEMTELAQEGLARFRGDVPVYVRPMYWARHGDASLINADPASTAFALCLEALPMADPEAMPEGGLRITTTRFRRPLQTMAPTEAKAGCLYPNNARMIREAKAKGFDNALSLDAIGNVAELATANVFVVKDGVIATPIPNGTFLAGITRLRVIRLMREAGHDVRECVLTERDVREADEVFSSGNANKIMPIVRFDDVVYGAGPVTREVRARYWDYAHAA